ncbi:phosphopantetheine adenylyltransferase [Caenimonas sedimenti]|uniref:Phosphopantetheine adenylyltransferase n=1 Tax=Caenimonas sedimenti TaxID=2596921 RepID=A0A562ZR47_9BURK|nr:phosphopantetheine adenylyltransferase [Caenimonas sedimenti]TWO70857.1 phosphopantetheine adenylyltransferase [Caenimonas sedimenti]
MRHLPAIALFLVGLIHLLPLAGVLGAARLASLYGVDATEPNLQILLRHRAVLFGLLGLFLCTSAFRPALQPLAWIGGFISVVSFIVIAWAVGGANAQVGRVFAMDLAALALLLVAAAAAWPAWWPSVNASSKIE